MTGESAKFPANREAFAAEAAPERETPLDLPELRDCVFPVNRKFSSCNLDRSGRLSDHVVPMLVAGFVLALGAGGKRVDDPGAVLAGAGEQRRRPFPAGTTTRAGRQVYS